jgi:16S rRNA (guanine527-N7)-methyltransferase
MKKATDVKITREEVATALQPFGVHPSDEQIGMIREYIRLLLEWNQSISLTAIEDPREIVARHFGECMFAACVLSVEKCRLADVGTGAGFPGLAVKIACPTLKLLLIESNQKKCVFLLEVVRTLGLTAVEIIPKRFEEVNESSGQIDFVAARALGGFPRLLRWARNCLTERGNVILWVGSDDVNTISTNVDWLWQPPVKIPESQRRYLVIGRPNRK